MTVQGLHIPNQRDDHYIWNDDVHIHHTTVSSLGDFPSWVATVISLTSSESDSELPAEVPRFWHKQINKWPTDHQTNERTVILKASIYIFKIIFLRSVCRLLVAACVVPSSPILVTLMKEAPGSSETSVLTRATRRNNPEDTILHRLMKFKCKILPLLKLVSTTWRCKEGWR
jgi:hypothetical protein